MKFLYYIIVVVFTLGFSPITAQDPDSLGFDDERNDYLIDLEEELMNVSLMQQEARAQRSLLEIEEETDQVQHLKDKLVAEIAMLRDENQILSKNIERWISQSEALRRLIAKLNHENEMLLSENDDLLDATEASAEENDEVTIQHNLEAIEKNEEELNKLEEELRGLEEQIQEGEAGLEANEETIARFEDMIETCEWVITTNQSLLEDFRP